MIVHSFYFVYKILITQSPLSLLSSLSLSLSLSVSLSLFSLSLCLSSLCLSISSLSLSSLSPLSLSPSFSLSLWCARALLAKKRDPKKIFGGRRPPNPPLGNGAQRWVCATLGMSIAGYGLALGCGLALGYGLALGLGASCVEKSDTGSYDSVLFHA